VKLQEIIQESFSNPVNNNLAQKEGDTPLERGVLKEYYATQ
jgi:hypothetical protein